jgi:hypothetical protein
MFAQTVPPLVDFCHWYVGAGLPEAAAEKVTLWPIAAKRYCGCAVMNGRVSGGLTVTTAALLVALPCEFVATMRYCLPLSDSARTGVVYEAAVAPVMSVQELPLGELCHLYVGVGLPEAAATKVAVWPAVRVRWSGWAVMVGTGRTELNVSNAALLVALPCVFVATMRYCLPLSDAASTGVVYETAVAPAMSAQELPLGELCHLYVGVGLPEAAAVNVTV